MRRLTDESREHRCLRWRLSNAGCGEGEAVARVCAMSNFCGADCSAGQGFWRPCVPAPDGGYLPGRRRTLPAVGGRAVLHGGVAALQAQSARRQGADPGEQELEVSEIIRYTPDPWEGPVVEARSPWVRCWALVNQRPAAFLRHGSDQRQPAAAAAH